LKRRALALLVLILVGCAGQPSPTPSPRPASTGQLGIKQPQPNAIVTATSLHVEFQLTGARIVDQTTTNITPDTGHIHLSIDGKLISMNYQLAQDVGLQDFVPGPHLLQGEFVAADHAPFNPRVIVNVIFEYQPPGS